MSGLLLIVEPSEGIGAPGTLPALAFAQRWCEVNESQFTLLCLSNSAEQLSGFGAAEVLWAQHDALRNPTAEVMAEVAVRAAQACGAKSIACAGTSFGRGFVPRAAALLDIPMLSDVTVVESAGIYHRPMYAGNLTARVSVQGACAFTVRTTAFGTPKTGGTTPVTTLDLSGWSPFAGSQFIRLDAPQRTRPELTAARVVVTGGRPLRDAETFERVMGALADKLGGAVGATRAAVDSGIAPNELQVGQTGKAVAPELYIAAGVSGSVQHLAGMKDSRVIVAINTDPEAPIFSVADFGLVADLHTAVPELTSKL
jgi:electron transfer flavoprotein alpha subunit